MPEPHRKKRVLLTGASGMLGNRLTQHLADHFELTVAGHNNVLPQGQWLAISSDLITSDLNSLLAKHKPDTLINAAALATDKQCAEQPQLARQLNSELPARLAAQCQLHGCEFVHLSTDQVYDGGNSWYTELHVVKPVNNYGISKYQGELLVLESNADSIILRLALVYGRGSALKVPFSSWLIDQLSNGQSVNLFDDEFRTAIYIEDIGRLLVQLCTRPVAGGIYNAGGSERYSRYEFGCRLCEIFQYDTNLLQPVSASSMDFSQPRPADCSMKIDKLCASCDWLPTDTQTALLEIRKRANG